LTVTFCKLGRLLRKQGIPLKTFQQTRNSFYCVLTNFEPVFEPVPGPFMIIMQNEPLHDMACVVKRGAPPGCRWRLCASQHGTKHFFFGDKQYAVEKVRVRQNANNHKYYFPPEVTCIFSVLLLVEPIHKTPNTNEHSCKLESTTLRCISK